MPSAGDSNFKLGCTGNNSSMCWQFAFCTIGDSPLPSLVLLGIYTFSITAFEMLKVADMLTAGHAEPWLNT